MVMSSEIETDFVPSSTPLIVPALEGAESNEILHKHAEEMGFIVVQLLEKKGLNSLSIEKEIPLITWSIPPEHPNYITFTFLTSPLKNYDLAQFFSEMIMCWLAPNKRTEIIAAKHLEFTFTDLPKKHFFISQITSYISFSFKLSYGIRKSLIKLSDKSIILS